MDTILRWPHGHTGQGHRELYHPAVPHHHGGRHPLCSPVGAAPWLPEHQDTPGALSHVQCLHGWGCGHSAPHQENISQYVHEGSVTVAQRQTVSDSQLHGRYKLQQRSFQALCWEPNLAPCPNFFLGFISQVLLLLWPQSSSLCDHSGQQQTGSNLLETILTPDPTFRCLRKYCWDLMRRNSNLITSMWVVR